jgi:hypothetical protein
MEGSCSTGQSPQWAVVPVEEEEEDDEEEEEEEEEVYLSQFTTACLYYAVITDRRNLKLRSP